MAEAKTLGGDFDEHGGIGGFFACLDETRRVFRKNPPPAIRCRTHAQRLRHARSPSRIRRLGLRGALGSLGVRTPGSWACRPRNVRLGTSKGGATSTTNSGCPSVTPWRVRARLSSTVSSVRSRKAATSVVVRRSSGRRCPCCAVRMSCAPVGDFASSASAKGSDDENRADCARRL